MWCGRGGCVAVAVEGGVEFAAGGDVELGKDVAQVPFHGACAREQFGADLVVGAPCAGQLGDLFLLGRQFGA